MPLAVIADHFDHFWLTAVQPSRRREGPILLQFALTRCTKRRAAAVKIGVV